MSEIWTIFLDYCGSGIYPFLFLAALIYLLATEKDRKIRIVLAETSVVITVLFFFPLFKTVMDNADHPNMGAENENQEQPGKADGLMAAMAAVAGDSFTK